MKKIVKNFNNLIKKTIFKVQNKTNNNFQISAFNKFIIALISLLFFYLFYLSIPILYDKNWVQSNIESQLLREFKINFSTSSDISYRILPTPHFLVKDTKLFKDNEKMIALSEIKNLKIFITQGNFFDKKKIQLKEIKIENANFIFLKNNFKLLNDIGDNKFSNKKIKISNSNIFFKDHLNETIAIIKLSKAFLFFDNEDQSNLFNFKGEIFNIPFNFILKNKINFSKNKKININAKSLNLNVLNESTKKNNLINGKNSISFLNVKIDTKYKVDDNIITFVSNNSRLNNSKINYSGELSINPFDLDLKIDLGNFKISKLLYFNSTLTEFINTGLLFNDNISMKTSIIANSTSSEEIFQNANINFNINNGKINLNKTKLINKKIGLLELKNSNLFFSKNKLILNTDIIIDIQNSDELFSFLQTNKKLRKPIKNILINLDYDFLANEIEFNDIKVDKNEVNYEISKIIKSLNIKNLNNLNKTRRVLNELFKVYPG